MLYVHIPMLVYSIFNVLGAPKKPIGGFVYVP